MLMFKYWPNGRYRLIMFCVVAVFGAALANGAAAATYVVSPETKTVECQTMNGGIRPGDTLVLAGRSRSAITFNNCKGTESNPITISNDVRESGPLIVNQSGTGFQTQCKNCEYVVIDGTGKWSGAPAGVCGTSIDGGNWKLGRNNCGIVLRCVSGGPQSGLRVSGSSKFVTIKGVEIDGNVPKCSLRIGLSVNDHTYIPKPGEWREGIRLLNNYVHHTGTEGMYVGPNQANNGEDMQLRNNEIANNLVEYAGCDGINYKSAIAGTSSIHDNHITDTGQSHDGVSSGCSATGIALFEAGFTDVYSNYVEAPSPNSSGPGHCISQHISALSASSVARVPVRIFNNVVHNCKGNGISSSGGSASAAAPVPTIFNNTVVAPVGGAGIKVAGSAESCTVRDNIVAGPVIAVINSCNVSGNLIGIVESQKFADVADNDFRLTAESPAVDSGTGNCPTEDNVGTARPQHGVCDRGAFEFFTGQAATAPKPNPPGAVVVE